MKPKKKSPVAPILYVCFLIMVLFVALHGAPVQEAVEGLIATGEIERKDNILVFTDLLITRMENTPLSFRINRYTQDWLMYCGLGWLIVVLAIEGSKKNYIHGKEYGTSRWGTLADIKDLFASSIEAEEIKNAKKTKTWWGRWRLRAKLFKQCVKEGKVLRKAKLESLALKEKMDKEENERLHVVGDKKEEAAHHKKELARIEAETKEDIELAKRTAWKPYQFEFDYKNAVRSIDENAMLTDSAKAEQKAQAKEEYKKKLKSFYSKKDRIEEIKAHYKDADMLFTQTERISFYNWKLNQNTLIIGGSGSGKTRGYVMPNILQAHSSYIVTDPKGEILEKAGYFLSEIKGYKIRVLNLDDKSQSDGYNPFQYIHPERAGYEERVLSLIETIIINTDDGEKKGGNDPFWPKAERLFLQSVFFFTAVGFPPAERNMNTVMDLIGMLELAEEDDDKNSDLDIYARLFEERFGSRHIGVRQYKEFRNKASGKTAKSIVISAVARLAPFATSEVSRLFAYDSMHLDRVGEEKTAIFVVVPPTDSTFNFIAGMLFTQLFQELQYCATQVHKHNGQRLPVPCRFILDEFANTCTIPNFVKILAYARSFGIGITPILQSLEQIKNMYKEEWGVIIDNCNTLLYLGSITHMDTLEYMSKLLGKGTFDKRTTGRTRGRNGSSSQNEDVVGRELMDAAEIRMLPKEDCLFIVGGRYPFYSKKYEYKNHPNYRFTSDANRANSFHYTPPGPPEPEEEVNESYHGDEASVEASPKARENIDMEVTTVKMDSSVVGQLNRMTKNPDSYEPIPDEDLIVDDGDNTAAVVNQKTLQELVGEEEAARETSKGYVSEGAKVFIENMRNERIRVETGLLQAVNRLGRTFRNLEPIPDEELVVDDGEGTAAIIDKMAEYILDEDDGVSPEEFNDILGDTLEDITAMVSNLGDSLDVDTSL